MGLHDKETSNEKDADIYFKLILSTIVCLTVVFVISYLIICLCVVMPTSIQEGCAETLRTLITLGFGTICGLLGGKSI